MENVTIYPSDFGLERMKEEDVLGPRELVGNKSSNAGDRNEAENDDDVGGGGGGGGGGQDEDNEEYHLEKLRQYQLNRLKYYYAVVDCDSPETAAKIYEECDGQEFESSAAK